MTIPDFQTAMRPTLALLAALCRVDEDFFDTL